MEDKEAVQTGLDPESHGSEHDEHQDSHKERVSAFKSLGILDKFLVLWILLAMIIGILLGNFVSNTGPALQKGKFVGVSVPIGGYHSIKLPFKHTDQCQAVGLLVMMYPILCKIKYESLHMVLGKRQIWVQIGISIFLNWIVAPLFMVSRYTGMKRALSLKGQ